jgi:flagellar biosynthesis protein FlhB
MVKQLHNVKSKKKICQLTLDALFYLLFTLDDLVIQSLVCLHMVCFRVIQFDAIQVWHFICEFKMTPHTEANLRQRPHLAFK